MSNTNKRHTQTECHDHTQDMTEYVHLTQSLQTPSRHTAADLGEIPRQHAYDGMALMTCGLSPSDTSNRFQSSVIGGTAFLVFNLNSSQLNVNSFSFPN